MDEDVEDWKEFVLSNFVCIFILKFCFFGCIYCLIEIIMSIIDYFFYLWICSLLKNCFKKIDISFCFVNCLVIIFNGLGWWLVKDNIYF